MKLYCGDCLKVLPTLASESVDAVITDPPYGLEFMGKEWDSFKKINEYRAGLPFQSWCFSWATECLRVLKTGGFLLAFGGTRTHHRLTCALEDAGFIIRDELMWGYASGFPKAQDLAMLISKREGAVREGAGSKGNTFPLKPEYREMSLTENGRKWVGWKTPALKPAWEPIILAQKPCVGSITENVLKHEVGGFNIDACRIPLEKNDVDLARCNKIDNGMFEVGNNNNNAQIRKELGLTPAGRFPSNVVLTDAVLEEGFNKFFLIPKTSASEKHEDPFGDELSVDGKIAIRIGQLENYDGRVIRPKKNFHPTVKPIALMRHLIKLVTREEQLVLDPFAGSGSTLLACRELRRDCVGIEQNKEYCAIARARFGTTLGEKLEYEEEAT